MQSENSPKINHVVLVLVIFNVVIVLLIAIITIYFKYSIQIEDYCQKQAGIRVPQGKLAPPTAEEKKEFPGMGSIDTQFRAKLQCEKEHRVFGFF